MAAAAPTAPSGVPRLVSLGLFKQWELVGPPAEGGAGGAAVCIPPPPPPGAAPATDDADAAEACRAALRRQAVYVRGFTGGELELPQQVKGLRVEATERAGIHLAGGCLASVELLRCRRMTLRVDAPVAALRVDDCDDVTVELGWAARHGFDDGSGATASTGFNVFACGSHGVRVSFPTGPAPGAPRVERLLPEVLHTRFDSAHGEPSTSVVDAAAPWGAAGVPRAPGAVAGAGGGGGSRRPPLSGAPAAAAATTPAAPPQRAQEESEGDTAMVVELVVVGAPSAGGGGAAPAPEDEEPT